MDNGTDIQQNGPQKKLESLPALQADARGLFRSGFTFLQQVYFYIHTHATIPLIAIAVLSFLIYGIFINSADLEEYTLQHAGVEAVAERGTFELGLSKTPLLRNPGDVFVLAGKLYAAKQPGQFVIGAIPYRLLATLGIRYSNHYDLAAALVVWFSSSLAAVGSAVLIYLLVARFWALGQGVAAGCALLYLFGTPAFPYVSVPHHDVIACFFLVACFFLHEYVLHGKTQSQHIAAAAASGVCASFAISVSMLPLPVTLTLLLYALITKPKLFPATIAGFFAGIVPLACYNYSHFGGFFTQANVAGDFSDTFFHPGLDRLLANARFYFWDSPVAVWKFFPAVVLSGAGLLFAPRGFARERCCIAALLAAHLAYLLQIESQGGCQYGPRYLMPLFPFFTAAAAFLLSGNTLVRKLNRIVLGIAWLYSVVIGATGALFGTMYCALLNFPFIRYWSAFTRLHSQTFPLAFFCSLAAAGYAAFLYRQSSAQPYQGSVPYRKSRAGLMGILAAVAVAALYLAGASSYNSPYDYTRRIAEALCAGRLGLIETPPSWLNEFVPWEGRYYSVFPLGAVLCILPFYLARLVVPFLGDTATIAAVVSAGCFYFVYRLALTLNPNKISALLFGIFLVCGTWQLTAVLSGSAWCLALGFAVLGELGALYYVLTGGSPLLAGFFFAMAFGNRTEIILTAPIFLCLLPVADSTAKQRRLRILLFSFFPVLLLAATSAYNYARFGSIFDFGYKRIPFVMLEPWYRDGLFSISSIRRNMWAMLFEGWKIVRHYPYLTPTGFGGSILLACPFLVMLVRPAKCNRPIVGAAWTAIAILTFVLWLHGNPGGWQFSYRYAIELLPWILLIMFHSCAERFTRLEFSLYTISLAVNVYAAYLFLWTRYVQP